MKIKLIPERQGGHLNAEEVKIKLIPERQGDHLHAEGVEEKKSFKNAMEVTCMQKRVEIKSNTIYRRQWRSPVCRM